MCNYIRNMLRGREAILTALYINVIVDIYISMYILIHIYVSMYYWRSAHTRKSCRNLAKSN